MAIEIVDLPIQNGEFTLFFCMFTRGYNSDYPEILPFTQMCCAVTFSLSRLYVFGVEISGVLQGSLTYQ